jgi:esterase/lipase superfamily enzyme
MSSAGLQPATKPFPFIASGQVIDDFGQGVSESRVQLVYGLSDIEIVKSNQLGHFELQTMVSRPGMYKLIAVKAGFSNDSLEFRIDQPTEGETFKIVVAFRLLRELEVTGFVPTGAELIELSESADNDYVEFEFDMGSAQPSTESERANEILELSRISSRPPARNQKVPLESHVTIRVFYGTDRALSGNPSPNRRFTADRDAGKLHTGWCDVAIPEAHRIGNIEEPGTFLGITRAENPDRHVTIISLTELDHAQFISSAKEHSGNGSAFIFVHGYNVTFPEAARRAAQLTFDLNFKGLPMFFSWASKGQYLGYPDDEATVGASAYQLRDFLQMVLQEIRPASLHLVAHSMGSRAVFRSLELLRGTERSFGSLVFGAPDIDAAEFEAGVPGILPRIVCTTLYASSEDFAITLSRRFHGFPRAGESGDGIVVVDGVDTIDATSVAGGNHSYFAESRDVLSDIYALFNNGSRPPRFGIKPAKCAKGTYWRFSD